MRLATSLVVASSLLSSTMVQAEARFSPDRFRAHVNFLADDLLEGRDAGTRGYDIAALYVATQFEQLGLTPAVKGGWYQDVPLRAGRLTKRSSPNIIGMIPGSDQSVADEYVLMTAHLDHVGTTLGSGDQVHNGALDNASGVSAMLEIARAMMSDGKRPRRPILFAALTAEEDGLVGSQYLARHPVVGRSRVVAVINMDMPVLLYDFVDVTAYGGEHSTLGETARRAGASMGVTLGPDPNKGEDFFGRSDHFSFVQRGIPALFLMTGYGNGGEEKVKRFLEQDYHQPSDDLDQPIDWDAGAKFSRLNYLILRDVADAAEAPRWYAGDRLGDSYAPREPKAPRPAS